MKKVYSKPYSKVVFFPNEEIIATSDNIDVENDSGYATIVGAMDSKKRENIDFSDEESIW